MMMNQWTQKDREALRRNLKKINNYIEKNIIPRMAGTRVSVPFGEIEQYPTGPEHKYHLVVSDCGVYGMSGYLAMTLLPTKDASSYQSSFCDRVGDGIVLLQYWPDIKVALENHLQRTTDAKELLYNFSV